MTPKVIVDRKCLNKDRNGHGWNAFEYETCESGISEEWEGYNKDRKFASGTSLMIITSGTRERFTELMVNLLCYFQKRYLIELKE